MKAWRALLVAEFRRAAGMLPWLAGLHGLTLGARTRWAWNVSPNSLALLEWASWTVAGLVVGISLWQDAPLRRDRFLATRPHRLAMLVTAKALALWGIAVLPFVAVECAALRLNGMAGEIVGLGTLQLAVWLTALLAAAFPLLWWWSTRRMAVAGLLTGVIALVLATLALSRLPGNRNIYSGTPWTVPVSPVSVLGTVGLFALGGWLLLPLLRARGGVLRGMAFSALAGLCLWGGLVVGFREEPADEVVPASLADLTVRCEKYQSGDYDILSLRVPGYPVPVDIERTWRLAKFEVDGRDLTLWPSNGIRADPPSDCLDRVIREHLGKPVEWNGGANGETEPTDRGVLPGTHSPDRRVKLAADVLEIRHAWKVVADLPVRVGAAASHGDTRWRITGVPPASVEAAQIVSITVEICQGQAWFGEPSRIREDATSADVLMLVDQTSGKAKRIHELTGLPGGGLRLLATALRHQRHRLEIWFGDGSPMDWNHEIRLIVMRPGVVRRILHPWRPQGEIRLRIPAADSGPQSRRSEPGPGLPIAGWLAAHPVPGEGSSATAAEMWLEELSGFLATGWNFSMLTDAGLKRAMAVLVSAHPVVALEAYHRACRWYRHVAGPLGDALRDHLTAERLARIPDWHTDPLVVALAVSKGWVPVIADAVTRRAKNGGITEVGAALTGAPEQIGLSEAEWLDYFRLRPSGATYQALADKVVPRSALDREVELILGPLRTWPQAAMWRTPLDLALGSGRREGLVWLRDALSPGRLHPGYTALFMENFMIPERPRVRGQSREESFREWFLEQDVSRFVYDPKTRKYHLP